MDRPDRPPRDSSFVLLSTLFGAVGDALNLRHLRGELYAPDRSRDQPFAGSATSFDARRRALQFPNVDAAPQNPRAKIDVRIA
jgi:hypothetical protein